MNATLSVIWTWHVYPTLWTDNHYAVYTFILYIWLTPKYLDILGAWWLQNQIYHIWWHLRHYTRKKLERAKKFTLNLVCKVEACHSLILSSTFTSIDYNFISVISTYPISIILFTCMTLFLLLLALSKELWRCISWFIMPKSASTHSNH